MAAKLPEPDFAWRRTRFRHRLARMPLWAVAAPLRHGKGEPSESFTASIVQAHHFFCSCRFHLLHGPQRMS